MRPHVTFIALQKRWICWGTNPLGFLANGESKAELDHICNTYQDIQILGNTDDLPSVLKTEHIDEVVLASKQLDSETIISTIQTCKRADIQFSIIPNFFEILMHQMRVEEVADIPIFQLDEGIFHRSGRFLKRGLDIVCSLLVLTLLAPFYSHTRHLYSLGFQGARAISPGTYWQGRADIPRVQVQVDVRGCRGETPPHSQKNTMFRMMGC